MLFWLSAVCANPFVCTEKRHPPTVRVTFSRVEEPQSDRINMLQHPMGRTVHLPIDLLVGGFNPSEKY